MKKIFFVIMILIGFNIFSEENENLDINANKTEEVIVEENNNEDEKSEVVVTDTSEFSSETEEKNKMFIITDINLLFSNPHCQVNCNFSPQ